MIDVVKFHLEETVYLKLKPDEAGMITGILYRQTGIQYFVSWGDREETNHYEMELTTESKPFEKSTD